MEDKFLESIAYILPAAVTGFVAYYMFNGMIRQQNSDKKLAIMAERKKDSLPIKLQAYERLLLFSDRINPLKMFHRIQPTSESTKDYVQLLIANIEQEFEHNLVQQIYVSKDTWTAIIAAKNVIIHKLKQTAETSNSAKHFIENIFNVYATTLPPSETAIAIIKREVKKLL